MCTREAVPNNPKIYHIVHIDRLSSIINEGCLLCDSEIMQRESSYPTIGMSKIKHRRLEKTLSSYTDLRVGDCVPFYFCPRSVMLFMFKKDNHDEISYHGGQEPIVHIEADLRKTVEWANAQSKRWAFTNSNAGSYYFDDYSDLDKLNHLDWKAIKSDYWSDCRDKKQAEFLIEQQFPWALVERIGVYSNEYFNKVSKSVSQISNKPCIEIKPEWYY